MTPKKSLSGSMTSGNPFRLILLFSLPLIAGNALQQVYNMADSIIVGNYVGSTALVAVGGAFPIIFIMSSLFMGLGIGSMVMVSQFYGAEDFDNLRKTIDTIYTFLICAGIPISIISALCTNPILDLMSVPEDARSEAYIYLIIVLSGLLGSLGYNANTGILQGVGDSKTPLILLALACLLDNGLNLLFVLVFKMGVAGAALSTVIGQMASWIFGIFFINKRYPMLKIRPFSFRFHKAAFYQIMKLGLPAGIQNALIGIATLLLTRLTNLQGSVFAAGISGANKLDTFAFLPIVSFSTAATAFTGQNIGAGKVERVKQGVRATIIISLCFSALSLLVIPFGPQLLRMFTPEKDVIESGMVFLRTVMPFYFLLGILYILNSVIRGSGESIIPMITVLIGVCVVRLPIAHLIEHYWGAEYMFYSYAIGWICSLSIVIPYYLSGKWKGKGITALSQAMNAADMGDGVM